MQIIPAIDLIDGKCVRLTRGDFTNKKIYHSNPLDVALRFEDMGIRRLHLVDLDGARSGKVVHYKILETLASHTSLAIDFGGGIKTDDEINRVFNAGARYATIGSMAVRNREQFLQLVKAFGPEKIILCADVESEKVVIDGWRRKTKDSIHGFLEEYLKQGITHVICTDVGKDGTLGGPSISLYEKIMMGFPSLQLIASGGVSNLRDLVDLKETGVGGVIIGKAIYEGRISLSDIQEFLIQC
ncbi:MAG: 1-(5-phosphoribosyl)-5-[(5-phosphoribosylamino)methylideneamino]imidazole-4-carboxamide isomerase [Bacteroidales bacterium]|jgi:phosphoribosylformimino-5-aminoimidazole carboxamide ribotide isomerase|nr:1-(5-phosphoribosyl)-5-[(5-phosphoribosylamino)methylideneamino]imidazole-4-carboxamide isomerase [Bacteroidales bacterium]